MISGGRSRGLWRRPLRRLRGAEADAEAGRFPYDISLVIRTLKATLAVEENKSPRELKLHVSKQLEEG